MEPSSSSLLAQSLRQRISPVVMVLPTPAVEDSCRKNNLSFLDMLRPFSSIQQIDVPVRTASDQPYRLQEFRLRLFYPAEICQTTAEIAEEQLLKVVNNSSDDALAELSGDPQKLEVVQQMVQSESLSYWFQRYSNSFIQSLAFSDHEAIDHPVACVRVVSSRDENPVNKFVDLFETDQMPALLNDGNMDPKLLKIYVLLHDNQDGPPDRANEVLAEMRGTFGFNECCLLCINSGSVGDNTMQEEFWRSTSVISTPTKYVEVPQLNMGCFLNENDVNEISELMIHLSTKLVLPYMEQKIRLLNQQVVATRKGLKNQIKNLWWRKGKDETADATNNSVYIFSSTESQIRVLGDYAFMLRDYELALSNYRLLSSDYKTDKAWKHYAGVQEMIGLSLFMLDQSRKEAELSMESAFSTYQKLGPLGQRYCTRCSLWWAEMHKARGQYKEAAGVLFRASTEEPHLRAGIFLEQAAYCYLRATPSMLRKYGFHLVLAGNRYNVCGQKKHAFRAYTSVLTIFDGQGWNYINDHVLFHLGRLSAFLGNSDVAVQHFIKLIPCSHQSPTNQAAFLREFLHVVQNLSQDKQKMLRLDLPAINMDSIRVHFEDQRTYASPAAAVLPEDTWLPLEAPMIPSTAANITTWLDALSTKSEELNNFNQCIAGEDLSVDVEFINPLQIPLNLSAVSLMCEFSSEISEKEQGTPKEVESGDLKETDQKTSSPWDVGKQQDKGQQILPVKIAEESFTIKPGEKFLAQLKVVPYKKGTLCVIGVKWTLSGVVTGYQKFVIEGSKRRRARGRNNNVHAHPPHRRLKFRVIEHMPRMEVSLHGMPGKVNSGELHRIVLELSNTSDAATKNFKFHSSHPCILLVGDPEELDAEFPSCLEAHTPAKQERTNNHHSEDVVVATASTYAFPQNVVLEGRSTLLWPLWLHAREAGTLLLNNVLYYEAEKTTTGLQYRTTRMSHTLQVCPSLRASVHISPCQLQVEQYLLRLDIANEHSSESFWLRQVSCVGKSWQIAPLLPPVIDSVNSGGRMVDVNDTGAAFLSASVCPSQLLPAGQSLSLFFQLLDAHSEKQKTKGSVHLHNSELISDVRLGPPSSSEPLIDVTMGPLSKFHKLERALREKEASNPLVPSLLKNVESKLDLVLISEQQYESSAEKLASLRDNQRLATHHICHCSVKQSSPVVWIMEGPRTITHDFSADPSCNVSFYLTVKNCSSRAASVKVDMTSVGSSVTNTSPEVSKSTLGNQIGWYDILLETPANVAARSSADSGLLERTDSSKYEDGFQETITPATPFIWCSLSSFKNSELGAGLAEVYPLHISVFAPGTYDLSGYCVSWQLLPKPSNVSSSGKQEEPLSSATPITWSSNYVASQGEQLKTGNSEPYDSEMDIISGFGCGHPLILTVEDRVV